MPRTPPPQGYVGMREALSHLHSRGLTIGASMFYKYVGEEEGKIRPHGPRKTKYYSLDELNRFADAQIGHSRSEGDLAFARATLDDLEGITTVARKLFKHPHAPFISTETRQAWLLKEPRGHYIVKRPNGEVVAWLHIVALTDETIKRYMNREVYGRNLTADDVQILVPGRSQSCILLSIGTDPDLDKGRRDGKKPVGSKCMSTLLHGMSQDLTLLGMQGIIIDKVYAWSETREGITMCTKMGMQQYAQPYKPPREPRRYTFYLDVQQSTMPLVRGYQRSLREWHRAHAQEKALTSPTDAPVIWKDATPQTPIERPLISPTTPPTIWQTVIPPMRPKEPQIATTEALDGVSLRTFASIHHINPRTATDQARIGTGGEILDVTEREAGRGKDKWFVTPEQQHQAIAFWQKHKTPGFTPCPDCPH